MKRGVERFPFLDSSRRSAIALPQLAKTVRAEEPRWPRAGLEPSRPKKRAIWGPEACGSKEGKAVLFRTAVGPGSPTRVARGGVEIRAQATPECASGVRGMLHGNPAVSRKTKARKSLPRAEPRGQSTRLSRQRQEKPESLGHSAVPA
jgi:hypothetical protein